MTIDQFWKTVEDLPRQGADHALEGRLEQLSPEDLNGFGRMDKLLKQFVMHRRSSTGLNTVLMGWLAGVNYPGRSLFHRH